MAVALAEIPLSAAADFSTAPPDCVNLCVLRMRCSCRFPNKAETTAAGLRRFCNGRTARSCGSR